MEGLSRTKIRFVRGKGDVELLFVRNPFVSFPWWILVLFHGEPSGTVYAFLALAVEDVGDAIPILIIKGVVEVKKTALKKIVRQITKEWNPEPPVCRCCGAMNPDGGDVCGSCGENTSSLPETPFTLHHLLVDKAVISLDVETKTEKV